MQSKSVSGEFCIYKEFALELNKNFVNFYDSFCWIIDAFVIVIIKANSILYTPNCKLKTVDKLYSMYKRLTTKQETKVIYLVSMLDDFRGIDGPKTSH